MRAALLLALALLPGCAATQARAGDHTLDPGATAQAFEQRSLSDPALRAFLAKHQEACPTTGWDLDRLTLVAIYEQPQLAAARAHLAAAQAAAITAGQSPPLGVSIAPQYAPEPEFGTSPWTLGLTLEVPVETAGKRGDRVRAAEALSTAARLDLASAAWQARARIRSALLTRLIAARKVQSLIGLVELDRARVQLLRDRLAIGQAARPDLQTVEADELASEGALTAARADEEASLVSLAAAVGLPSPALAHAALVWPGLMHPPDPRAWDSPRLRRLGLANRLDVQRALAVYQSAHESLRLALAERVPNVSLGPSYTWEQGSGLYGVSVSLTLPQTRGPIAEATARREEAAANFLAAQALAINQIEAAGVSYRAASEALRQSASAERLADARAQSVRLALEVGQDDRLAWLDAERLARATARASLDATMAAQSALGGLEDAIQRPLEVVAARGGLAS